MDKSWSSTLERSADGSDLLDRLLKDEDFYGSDESTNYLLDVTNFEQVGEHYVVFDVTSSHPLA